MKAVSVLTSAINQAFARFFHVRIISTGTLSRLTNQYNESLHRLHELELNRKNQLDDRLHQLEMATTEVLADRPCVKKGVLDFETTYPIFNPSVVQFDDGFVFMSRSTNLSTTLDQHYQYASSPHCSINVLHTLDQSLGNEKKTIVDDSLLQLRCASAKYGIEDSRLFVWKGELWGVASGISPNRDLGLGAGPALEITQILFRLDGNKIVHFDELRSPIGCMTEKNWIPLVSGGELFFVYGIRPYTVLKYQDGELTSVRGTLPAHNGGSVRGSTQFVAWNSKYLGIAHLDREYVGSKHFRRHVFVVIDKNMNLEQISEPFFIQRRGLEFACGLSNHEQGLLLSFGVMNQTSEFCIVPFAELPRWVAS